MSEARHHQLEIAWMLHKADTVFCAMHAHVLSGTLLMLFFKSKMLF